ncbi:MAG: hypothetical protein FIB01_06950 [Gemmatimonadetes bacterium]|nr:hypothetical protein [Gemmatimonadota bacterium]
MKTPVMLLLGMAIAFAAGGAHAQQSPSDYSNIRGVNYGMQADTVQLVRELGYAKRLNLNSTRIWLSYQAYQRDPKAYIDRLRTYIRISHRLGFTTMPILWNGNSLDPATLKSDFRATGDAYVKGIVDAVKDEPGLLMWDIMNEPLWNDYVNAAPADAKQQRIDEIFAFTRYYVTYVKKLDPKTPTTVGHVIPEHLKGEADLVDVLGFHDYTGLRSTIEASYDTAAAYAAKYKKPMMNTETGCIARANPYDLVLQISEEKHTGWYIFNLMVSGYWGEIHGIFYPDGTIRDPAIVAAIMGFYRNRNLETIIRPMPNREGHVTDAIKGIEAALNDNPSTFRYTANSIDKLLDAAEYAANLLESAEMVPMNVPPTAQIKFWRGQAPEKRDRAAIRAFTYELGQTLKKHNQLY